MLTLNGGGGGVISLSRNTTPTSIVTEVIVIEAIQARVVDLIFHISFLLFCCLFASVVILKVSPLIKFIRFASDGCINIIVLNTKRVIGYGGY